MIYFPTNWGAKEPQNLPNHGVDIRCPKMEQASSVFEFLDRLPGVREFVMSRPGAQKTGAIGKPTGRWLENYTP